MSYPTRAELARLDLGALCALDDDLAEICCVIAAAARQIEQLGDGYASKATTIRETLAELEPLRAQVAREIGERQR